MLRNLGHFATLGIVALAFGCSEGVGTAQPSGDTAGHSGAAGAGVLSGLGGVGGSAGGIGDGVGGLSGGSNSLGGSSGGLPNSNAGASSGGSGGSGGGTVGVAGGPATGGVAGAASGGAASNGGAAGSGSASCAGLICEDFESGKVDTDKWDLVAKGGTFTVQGQRVAHGAFAGQVHGVAGASDDWALLVAKNVPATLKGATSYGRVLMYTVPDTAASIHIQLAFAGHTGTGSANGPAPFSKLRYMEVASYSGRWQLGFDLLDLSPLVEEVSYSNSHIPNNAWVCMEWQFEDSPDRVTTWLDGAQVGTFDNTNVAYASPGPIPKAGSALWDGKSSGLIGGFDTFGFGFHDWHPQRAFDIYYDDLVLDAKRVGCPAKP